MSEKFCKFAAQKKAKNMNTRRHIRTLYEKDRMRGISCAFSRRTFTDVLKYSDYSYLDSIVDTYDFNKRCTTYYDVLGVLYRNMLRSYQNEYVYKNELISRWLLEEYGTKNTVYFSEFRVGNSIADLAIFNGESKAFEIKSEIDTPKRLARQMTDYSLFFDKCYIVIPKRKVSEYEETIDSKVGMLTFEKKGRTIDIKEYRPAERNTRLDAHYVMDVLRTKEYLNIIARYYGKLPAVPMAQMYDECDRLMEEIPEDILRKEVLTEIKRRRRNAFQIRKCSPMLRQMFLSLNLSQREAEALQEKFKQPI